MHIATGQRPRLGAYLSDLDAEVQDISGAIKQKEAELKEADGSVQQTEEADADLEAVRRLFELLLKFAQDDAPGFQLIVTEHANLPEQWFQDALVEQPWTKPPALVPEYWPLESGEPSVN